MQLLATAAKIFAVTEIPPAGMTLVSMSGTGWDCTTLPACTRTDGLAGGASYPPIIVMANIQNEVATQFTNRVTLSVAGTPVAWASNDTTITCNSSPATASGVGGVVLEAVGSAAPQHDWNHDQTVNVLDVQKTINNALGVVCLY